MNKMKKIVYSDGLSIAINNMKWITFAFFMSYWTERDCVKYQYDHIELWKNNHFKISLIWAKILLPNTVL